MRPRSSARGPAHPLVCLLVGHVLNPCDVIFHAHTHVDPNMFCHYTRTRYNACTCEQKFREIWVAKSYEDVDQDISSTWLPDVCSWRGMGRHFFISDVMNLKSLKFCVLIHDMGDGWDQWTWLGYELWWIEGRFNVCSRNACIWVATIDAGS